MRLLLHACCGPCSIMPARILADEGAQIAIAYSNPNIAPEEEYRRRLDTLCDWARPQGIEVIECEYDPESWEQRAGVHGTDRASRCRACYQLRFERVARMAAESGYDAISTTLSVSPYQFTDVIADELEKAATSAGIDALFRDFRPYYPDATRISRELGMYRQNYCGCRFSMREAQAERDERRAARRAAQAGRRAARAAAYQAFAQGGTDK